MMKKLLVAAGFAGAMLFATTPAHAAAYFIAGQWYYFSINFQGKIAKLTGGEIKDQTVIETASTILTSEVLCANPQYNVINPGKGPRTDVTAESSPVTESDVVDKKDRQKRNEFSKTATALLARGADEEPFLPNASLLCKDALGQSAWVLVYWQDKQCLKAGVAYPDPAFQATDECYSDLAVKTGAAPGTDYSIFQYVTGSNSGSTFVDSSNNWTYVYLPTSFAARANLETGGDDQATSFKYYRCSFDPNPSNGQPYGLANPPAGGWGATEVPYACTDITRQEYEQLVAPVQQ